MWQAVRIPPPSDGGEIYQQDEGGQIKLIPLPGRFRRPVSVLILQSASLCPDGFIPL